MSEHTERPHRLLVADDDGHIREVMRFALEQAGHEVHQAADGRQALDAFAQAESEAPFDLLILDIVMPGMDGLEVCRQIRAKSRVPIIFVSSRDEELDRVLGLELGADDYVTKPFSPRELVARTKATLRRYAEIQELLRAAPTSSEETTPPSEELTHGPLSLDPKKHEVRVGDSPVVLTVSEFSILQALLDRPDQVLSRAQLVEKAYGAQHFLSDRTIDSHVRRIRKKLKTAGYECIETVYGVGYRLLEPPA